MSEAPAADAPSLESLAAQLADEFRDRLERGERPSVEEYVRRYPQVGDVIRNLLRSLELIRLSAPGPDGGDLPPAPESEVPSCLGDFRIERELGRGGMGVVYQAVQVSLGRRVALKVLPFAAALDARQLQRFKNEAQAAAQLHHTNIVPVYAVGSERGVYYYAMQLVEGSPLSDLIVRLRREAADCPTGRLGPEVPPSAGLADTDPLAEALPTERPAGRADYFRTVARLGVEAAEALEHAHRLGVIHRDVKPANLLLDGRGNLWVTDFGLAHVRGDARLTLTGDLVGTLRYMSPEQALGTRGGVDHRTDVYSLGVTLYELLTLRPAFGGGDRQELLLRITSEEPRPPRRVNRAVPAELDTIVTKAIAKSPDERYATAQELADDLRRFLQNEPIRARRPTLWQVVWKWARRHRTVVLSLAGGALLALILAVVILAVKNAEIRAKQEETNREKLNAEQALGRERETSRALARSLDAHRIALAHAEWRANRVAQAERHLDECAPESRRWEWHYQKRLCHKDVRTFACGPGRASATAFSPDGRLLAVAAEASPNGATPVSVTIWDVAAGQAVRELDGLPSQTGCLAFSADGRLLAGSVGRDIQVWDAATGRDVQTLRGHEHSPRNLAFTPDGLFLASASTERGKCVRVWRVGTGEEVGAFQRGTLPQESPLLAFDADQRLVFRTLTGVVSWDWQAKTPTGSIRPVTAWNVEADVAHGSVALSRDSPYVAHVGLTPAVSVWNKATGKQERSLLGHVGPVASLALSPGSRLLASAGSDQTVRVWDLKTGREEGVFRGHTVPLSAVAFLPGGQRLASLDRDGTVKVWDLVASREALTLSRDASDLGAIKGLAFTRDGRLAGTTDRVVTEWDLTTGDMRRSTAVERTVEPHPRDAALSPDGGLVARTTRNDIELLDAAAGRRVQVCRGHTGLVNAVTFGPCVDGEVHPSWLASADQDSTVRVWDAATGRELVTCHGHTGPVWSVAFAPDGKRLASGGADRCVKLWDPATGAELLTLVGHTKRLGPLVFSRDGRHLAAAGLDHTIRVWELASGRLVHSMVGHNADILAVAFTGNDERLVSASGDGSIKVWDVTSGRELLALPGDGGVVCCLAFSPDGGRLISAGGGPVKVWDGRPLEQGVGDGGVSNNQP